MRSSLVLAYTVDVHNEVAPAFFSNCCRVEGERSKGNPKHLICHLATVRRQILQEASA
jgi:hypothetical protein